MFKKMTVLVSFVVAAALAGSAHADTGITPEPIDTGGVRWLVTPPGFLTPFNYGTLTAQAYSVSYAVQARSGCFVVSKGADVFGGWLPVAHANGMGTVYPEFYSTWEGVVPNNRTPSGTVFTLQVEVRTGINGPVTVQRKAIDAFLYNPEKIFFPTPSTTLYWGDLESARDNPNVVQTFNVNQDDNIRVSICDLAPESTIDVRRIVIETIPGRRSS